MIGGDGSSSVVKRNLGDSVRRYTRGIKRNRCLAILLKIDWRGNGRRGEGKGRGRKSREMVGSKEAGMIADSRRRPPPLQVGTINT